MLRLLAQENGDFERSRFNGENAYSTPTCPQVSWHLLQDKQIKFQRASVIEGQKKSVV